MTSKQIRENINAGLYRAKYPTNLPEIPPDGAVIDANMSVNWNKEEIAQRKAMRDLALKKYHDEDAKQQALFTTHVCEYIAEETGITTKQAQIIFNKAYAYGHAHGYFEVLAESQSLIEFINEFMEAGKE